MALEKRPISLCVGRGPQTLEEAEQTFIADCRARNLSPQTVTVNGIILRGLRTFLVEQDLLKISSADLRRFFIDKAASTTPATAARYYDCINRYFKFLADEGLIPANPMAGIDKPRAAVPVIEPLSQEQVEAMLQVCGNNFSGLRDRPCSLRLLILPQECSHWLSIVRHRAG